MGSLYKESSTVIWNGNVVKGTLSMIVEFLKALPPSTHNIESIDCHPIPAPGINNMLDRDDIGDIDIDIDRDKI